MTALSQWPCVAPPSATPWSAASAQMSLEFLMICATFMLPVLLNVCWPYLGFCGKVRSDIGYEHL
ncbi:hypothetical protein WS68_00050 [Burkholderia sp. TSV86]|nr:hypothetical protein WS68_00050 [Burkholderia sp. TSV86]